MALHKEKPSEINTNAFICRQTDVYRYIYFIHLSIHTGVQFTCKGSEKGLFRDKFQLKLLKPAV